MKIDGNRKQDRATELVLTYYAAFNRGDWAGMQALLAEDVVHDLNQGPRETGKPAFAAFQQRMERSYREQLRDFLKLVEPTSHEPMSLSLGFAMHREFAKTGDMRTVKWESYR